MQMQLATARLAHAQMQQAGTTEQPRGNDAHGLAPHRLVEHPSDLERLRTDHDGHGGALGESRRGDRTGGSSHPALPHHSTQGVDVPEEPDHERLHRAAVQILRRPGLDDPALAHQRDPVRHEHGLLGIVRHHERAGTAGFEDVQGIVADLIPKSRIKAGEGLVQQHQRGCRGKRPGERDPLLLATGEHMGIGVGVIAHVQLPEQGPGAGIALGRAQTIESERHVPQHGQMGKERGILEHQTDLATFRRRPDAGDRIRHEAAAHAHRSFLHRFETCCDPQQRALAAAAWAQQADHFVGRYREADVVDRTRPSTRARIAVPDMVEFEPQIRVRR